jgi:tRNA threonylcarbamoyladenosine biosynthesis protein TsaE
MSKKIITRDQMADVAKELVVELKDKKIITLSGPLGAGKTTLVQEILKQMSVTKPVISPTYTYVNVYRLPSGITVYHFDLYRLNTADEFIESGFNEYLYQPKSYCFIEWPQVIDSLLNKGVIAVELEHEADDTRSFSVILK